MVKTVYSHAIPLYLFVKAPTPGQVKTRMQPHLLAQQCVELATLLFQQSVENAIHYWPGQVVIAYSGDFEHAQFRKIRQNHSLEFIHQGDGDLGQRMQRCLQAGIEKSGAAAVIGCDVPYLEADIYQQLNDALLQGENVIGPAMDGGFYVMGLTQFDTPLFENVQWGGEDVYAKVMMNAKKLAWRWQVLAEKRDIDEWADLCWLSEQDKAYLPFVRQTKGMM